MGQQRGANQKKIKQWMRIVDTIIDDETGRLDRIREQTHKIWTQAREAQGIAAESPSDSEEFRWLGNILQTVVAIDSQLNAIGESLQGLSAQLMTRNTDLDQRDVEVR